MRPVPSAAEHQCTKLWATPSDLDAADFILRVADGVRHAVTPTLNTLNTLHASDEIQGR